MRILSGIKPTGNLTLGNYIGALKHFKDFQDSGEVFIFIAGLAATLMRMVGSTISSVVVYNYALAAGILYNLTYIPLCGLFATIVLMAMYGPMIKIEKMFPVSRK